MNKVILSGRICSEIELKSTTNDVSMCNFRIAVNRRFRNAEGNYDADFISCVAWRNDAEFICKYFSKGKPIEIVGSLQTRDYEKEDGQKVYITEVVVDEAYFVIANKDGNHEEQTSALPSDSVPSMAEMDGFLPTPADDDLPF